MYLSHVCRRVCFVILSLLFFTLPPVQAQIAVYAGFTGAPINNGSISSAYGPLVGLYAQTGSHIMFGGDVRGSFLTRNGFNYFTGAAGPRLAFKPPILPLRPYIEGLFGIAGIKNGNNDSSSTHFNYQIAGGIDATIFPHVDWRVIEFDYSAMSGAPTSASMFTTGLVLRLW
jgi:hypothetical protein